MCFFLRFFYPRLRIFLFRFCSSFNQCWIILSYSRSHATKDMVLYYVKATGLTGFSQLDTAIYEYSALLISNFTSLRIKARPTLRLFVRQKNFVFKEHAMNIPIHIDFWICNTNEQSPLFRLCLRGMYQSDYIEHITKALHNTEPEVLYSN